MGNARIVIPERGYFSLSRNAAQDDRLALSTRGLLALMLSLPADWDYTVTGLAIKAGCGREKMRRMIRELEDFGYLVREQAHGDGGKFEGNVYVLQDKPSPLPQNPSNGEADEPTVAPKPRQRQKPSTVFRPEQIIDQKIIDRNIPPYSPPKGDGAEEAKPKRQRAVKTVPDWQPERFEGFWAYYPRGENRVGAVRAWDRLRPDDALIERIGRALQTLKASEAWREGYGIPYASTFLNQRRWEDAAAKRPPARARAQPARRLEPPPDGENGEWTWSE